MAKNKSKTNNAPKAPVPAPAARKPKQAKKKKKNKTKQGASNNSNQVMRYLCGLTDPFCEHANIARIPDMSSTPSFTYTLTAVYDLTTNAQGRAIYNFTNNMQNPGQYAVMDNVGTIESWTQLPASSSFTNLTGEAVSYRTVSWGVHFITTQAPLYAQGLIKTGTIQWEASTITNINQNGFSNDIIMVPVKDASLVFASKPNDMEAYHYRNMDEVFVREWNSLVLMISGATASTVVGQLVCVYRLECRPEPNTVSARLARLPEPNIPTAMVASSKVRDALPGVFNEAKQAFSAAVEEEAVKAVSAAATGLRGMVMTSLLGGGI